MGCHLWFHMSDDLLFRKKISGKSLKGAKTNTVLTQIQGQRREYTFYLGKQMVADLGKSNRVEQSR